jgi:hypothetical protein
MRVFIAYDYDGFRELIGKLVRSIPGVKVCGEAASKPMSGWHSAWRSVTRSINCPACDVLQQPGNSCIDKKCQTDISKVRSPLHGLRFHDLRHHAITELAESQASERTVMAIAGHISSRMLEHYSHIRLEAKRKPPDALTAKRHDTNNVTNSPPALKAEPDVIEKDGGDDETRTRDLCRDRTAWLGFATSSKTAETGKLRGSRARHRTLWVKLWVGKSEFFVQYWLGPPSLNSAGSLK